jgi:8-oxo-dGTP pyrophosphatase MutT (NUDIX family)
MNPRLFDGPVLSVREIIPDIGVVRCTLDSYKRLVAQPEVETGVRMLSVTGVLMATDSAGRKRVLLGRRSHKTRMYGGMWQNCPAGGVDPLEGATRIDDDGLVAELLREVAEESGLQPAAGLRARPIAVIFDETARSHDLIVPLDMGPVSSLATTRGWEYDELKWLDIGCIAEFEQAEQGKIMAITRAVFRIMGWL